jgi:hypothetical protein
MNAAMAVDQMSFLKQAVDQMSLLLLLLRLEIE